MKTRSVVLAIADAHMSGSDLRGISGVDLGKSDPDFAFLFGACSVNYVASA